MINGRQFPSNQPRVCGDYIGQVPDSFLPLLSDSVLLRKDALPHQSRPRDPYDEFPIASPINTLSEQRCIAILGMHRSGTSLLAGTLQEAGLELGEVVTSAPFNLKGNRESLLIRALHDDLLAKAGGSWKSPPKSLSWDMYHKAIRDAIIASFRRYRVWGFKDPRTLLCLEGWIQSLPHLELIGIFRHPEAVARSLHARERMSLDEGISLWLSYNKRLLAWHQHFNFPLIEFTSDHDQFKSQASRMTEKLKLPNPLSSETIRFHDATLINQVENVAIHRKDVMDLYGRLRSIAADAQDSGSKSIQNSDPPLPVLHVCPSCNSKTYSRPGTLIICGLCHVEFVH